MVNKIPSELDNPIDVILYNQVDRDLEFYKSLGLTPNGLTTLSLIIGVLGVYNFYYDNNFLGAMLFFIAYYFDCADGKMARKYKMFTKYGGLYDEISDTIKHICLYVVMFIKSFDKFIKVLIISVIIYIFTLFYSYCQEKINGKNENSDYKNFFNVNLENCEEKIKYLKYFGPGTPMTFLTLSILLWNKI